MLSRIFVVLSFAAAVSSCGQKIQKTVVKSYILGVAQENSAFQPMLKALIEDYNTNVGSRVLQFSDSMDSVNSPVLITKGLEARDGKVGWGQWSTSTEHKGSTVPLPGVTSSEKTKYRLQVEFDEEFLTNNSKDASPGVPNYEVRKLFAHEIGHGFQMDHDPDVNQIMYMDISGEKTFGSYWPKVRDFFAL